MELSKFIIVQLKDLKNIRCREGVAMNSLGYLITGVVSIIFTSIICIASLACYGRRENIQRKIYGGLFLFGFVTLIFITNALCELVV